MDVNTILAIAIASVLNMTLGAACANMGQVYSLAMAGNVVSTLVFWRLLVFWGATSFFDIAVLGAFLGLYHAAIYIPHPLFDGQGLSVAGIHLGYDALRVLGASVVFWAFQVGAPEASNAA